MSESELSTAFREVLRPSVVMVLARKPDVDPDLVGVGTGCIIGYMRGNGGPPRAIVATAGHVLRHNADELLEVTVVRETTEGQGGRVATVMSDQVDKDGSYIVFYRDMSSLDLGFIVVPHECPDGQRFLSEDEGGQPTEHGTEVMQPHLLVTEGTQVAWAGYPRGVHQRLGERVLCYYEGVVSATYNDPDSPMYIIDGHTDNGVSGGPVWVWNEQRTGGARAQLVGVITEYYESHDDNEEGTAGFQEEETERRPGFVIAVPHNPLIRYMQERYAHGQVDASKSAA